MLTQTIETSAASEKPSDTPTGPGKGPMAPVWIVKLSQVYTYLASDAAEL